MHKSVFLALLATMLMGCSAPYTRTYRAGVSANRHNVQALRLGMSRQEVEAAMGAGEIVNYKKIQLRNPWRTESFRIDESRVREVLYYVTDGYVWQAWNEQYLLTPVMLDNGRVVGWGWAFLDEQKPSYVSGPAGQ